MTNNTELREQIAHLVDDFIVTWCKPHTAHLLDDDENDGEQLRQALTNLFATQHNNLLAELLEEGPEKPDIDLIRACLQNGKRQQAASYNGFAAAIDQYTALIKSKMEEK